MACEDMVVVWADVFAKAAQGRENLVTMERAGSIEMSRENAGGNVWWESDPEQEGG